MKPVRFLKKNASWGASKKDKVIWDASKSFVNTKIVDINALINKINQKPPLSAKEKVNYIRQIQKEIEEMEYRLSTDCFSGINKEYQQIIRIELFQSIQDELEALGYSSFTSESYTLAGIIKNMSPDKASYLTKILKEAFPNPILSFSQVYLKNDRSKEANRFNSLLNYEISYLGGTNNKSTKFTNATNQTQVLMLESSMHQVKSAAVQFSRSLGGEALTQRFVERPVGINYLVVTELCKKSLDNENKKKVTPEERQRKTASIYKQMARVLINIQNAGCFFPDAKNANWLIDFNGQLRIADCKSFRHAPDGIHSPGGDPLQYGVPIYTPGREPPELYNKDISVDKAHAYILGRNLLQALANISTKELEKLNSTAKLEEFIKKYSPIFDGIIGNEYKKLLSSLWSSNPRERISMKEAELRLELIDHLVHLTNEQYKNDLIKSFYGDRQLYNNHCKIENDFAIISLLYDPEESESWINVQREILELNEFKNSYNITEVCFLKMQEGFEALIKQLDEENKEFINKLREEFKNEPNKRAAVIKRCMAAIEFEKKVKEINNKEQTDPISHEFYKLDVSQDPSPCLSKLNQIKENELELEATLKAIQAFQFDTNDEEDKQMVNYINSLREGYLQSNDKEEYIAEMKRILYQMERDPILNEMHKEIKRYQAKAAKDETYANKANSIIKKMQKINVKDRGKIFSERKDEFLEVERALAAKRTKGELKPAEEDKGRIVESSAADGFKHLKSKYQQMIKKESRAAAEEMLRTRPK